MCPRRASPSLPHPPPSVPRPRSAPPRAKAPAGGQCRTVRWGGGPGAGPPRQRHQGGTAASVWARGVAAIVLLAATYALLAAAATPGGPGATPTWLPGSCGRRGRARRGRLGVTRSKLVLHIPSTGLQLINKTGQRATSTLMDIKVVFRLEAVAAPPAPPMVICYKALLQKYVELLHLYL